MDQLEPHQGRSGKFKRGDSKEPRGFKKKQKSKNRMILLFRCFLFNEVKILRIAKINEK